MKWLDFFFLICWPIWRFPAGRIFAVGICDVHLFFMLSCVDWKCCSCKNSTARFDSIRLKLNNINSNFGTLELWNRPVRFELATCSSIDTFCCCQIIENSFWIELNIMVTCWPPKRNIWRILDPSFKDSWRFLVILWDS